MRTTGFQLLLDLYDCAAVSLDDVGALERVMRDALRRAEFQIVDCVAHQFPHQGITLILILGQSHATLHTWPEARFVTADIYACGESNAIAPALETIRAELVRRFAPRAFTARVIERGLDTLAQKDV